MKKKGGLRGAPRLLTQTWARFAKQKKDVPCGTSFPVLRIPREEEERNTQSGSANYFAVAFLAAAVTSVVAFLTAAVASSEKSLPAASINSTVSI